MLLKTVFIKQRASHNKLVVNLSYTTLFKHKSHPLFRGIMSTDNVSTYNLEQIIEKIVPIISQYDAVNKAFIFGSYARGDADEKSDIDIRIDASDLKAIDYCGLAGRLMMVLDISMDLVESDRLSEEFLNTIRKQEVLIYERSVLL